MSHTPQQIADLARAALAWDGVPTIPEGHGEMAWLRYREATRDPATILALCERLHDLADDVAQEGCFEVETLVNWCMTTPLTPKARAEVDRCKSWQECVKEIAALPENEELKRQARLDALRWVCSQAMCADWHDLGERIKAEIARLESNA